MEAIYVNIYYMDSMVKVPRRVHPTDACWDLYSNVEMIIQPGTREVIPTGIKVGLPVGWELQIRPRSGLAAKEGLTVLNTPGTIDSGYRGEIKVILYNTSTESYLVFNGSRIAQMALKPVYDMKLIPVRSEEALGITERGEGGFGSSGE